VEIRRAAQVKSAYIRMKTGLRFGEKKIVGISLPFIVIFSFVLAFSMVSGFSTWTDGRWDSIFEYPIDGMRKQGV